MTTEEFAAIIDEIIDQPPSAPTDRHRGDLRRWQSTGFQAAAEAERAFGIPPAKENVIGPVPGCLRLRSKTHRLADTRWRSAGPGCGRCAELPAESGRAPFQGRRGDECRLPPQCSIGLGWVEVARSNDPFGYNKRCRYVHRNEIYWDMRAKEANLSDAGWLLREKFVKKSAKAAFPKFKELIDGADAASGMGGYGGYVVEGGSEYRFPGRAPTSIAPGRRRSRHGIAAKPTRYVSLSYGIAAGSISTSSRCAAVAGGVRRRECRASSGGNVGAGRP